MESRIAPSQRKTPKAGVDYPRNYAEFMAWFSDDAACLDYLDWIRWKDGFECPSCHGSKGWRMKNSKWWCDACRNRISPTAGTIFHHARTPLTVWFAAAWHMTSAKNGVYRQNASSNSRIWLLPYGLGDAAPVSVCHQQRWTRHVVWAR